MSINGSIKEKMKRAARIFAEDFDSILYDEPIQLPQETIEQQISIATYGDAEAQLQLLKTPSRALSSQAIVAAIQNFKGDMNAHRYIGVDLKPTYYNRVTIESAVAHGNLTPEQEVSIAKTKNYWAQVGLLKRGTFLAREPHISGEGLVATVENFSGDMNAKERDNNAPFKPYYYHNKSLIETAVQDCETLTPEQTKRILETGNESVQAGLAKRKRRNRGKSYRRR